MSPLPRQVSQLLLAPTSYLFFPFLTSSAPDQNAQNPRGHDHQRSTSSSSGTGNAASLETDRSPPPRSSSSSSTPLPPSPVEFDTNAAIALAFLLGSATALGASSVYRRFFKRIKSAEWITPDSLKRKRWITGVVTSVGDADNFRLYHTPGIGWRGLLKFRRVPTTKRELKGKTIHIRMAGMDAPEGGHFGRTAQPYHAEALLWLKANIQGRRIKCELLGRDQYQRVVALPLLPRTFRPWHHCRQRFTRTGSGVASASATTRNLPLEMVRAGWGVVYEQKGAVYGSDWDKETYLAAEAEAQAARRGMWQYGTNIESPADYKKRYRVGGVEAKVEEDSEEGEEREDVEHEGRVSFWSRIFGRK